MTGLDYTHLINACHSEAELAQLALLFAYAGAGLAILGERDVQYRQSLVPLLTSYRDAARMIETQYLATYTYKAPPPHGKDH